MWPGVNGIMSRNAMTCGVERMGKESCWPGREVGDGTS